MQGNAVHPPPISGSKRSSTSDCYSRIMTGKGKLPPTGGSDLNIQFP